MTPLPAVSPDPHTCDLCLNQINAGSRFAHATMLGGNVNYRAHAACEDLYGVIGDPAARLLDRREVFAANLPHLTPSDLCETLQAHPQEEIVRLLALRQRLQPPTLPEYIEAARTTDLVNTVKHAALGLLSEIGEVYGVLARIERGDNINRAERNALRGDGDHR